MLNESLMMLAKVSTRSGANLESAVCGTSLNDHSDAATNPIEFSLITLDDPGFGPKLSYNRNRMFQDL